MAFSLFGNTSRPELNPIWSALTSMEGLDAIFSNSESEPQLIFKHSTRCGISHRVLKNFEAEWNSTEHSGSLHFLDLLAYRGISDEVAKRMSVVHQSPQVLILFKGEAIANASHQDISAKESATQMNSVSE